MKIVIVGLRPGRSGARRRLSTRPRPRGHHRRPLDGRVRPAAGDFAGKAIRGDGTDEDILRRAGTEDADVFLALTEGDNRNVMAAQLATEAFGVKSVVAKINDPVRAEAYAELGIATICRTDLMVDAHRSSYLGPAGRTGAGRPPPAPHPASRRSDRAEPRADARRGPAVGRRRRPGRAERCSCSSSEAARSATTSPRSSSDRATRSSSWRRTPAARGQIADELGSIVLTRDGCEGKHLAEAGANRADVVAAVTGDDEDNLVICQMAKHHFDVPRTIARVNNPKNEELFRHLGVDEMISPTRMVLGSIEQDIPVHELLHLAGSAAVSSRSSRPSSAKARRRSAAPRATCRCPRVAPSSR